MERERGKGADTAVSWLYFNHPSAKTGDFGGSWSKFYHLTARGCGPVNPTATRRDRWRHGLGPKRAAGGPKGPPVLRFAGKMRPQRDRTREIHAEEEHTDKGTPRRPCRQRGIRPRKRPAGSRVSSPPAGTNEQSRDCAPASISAAACEFCKITRHQVIKYADNYNYSKPYQQEGGGHGFTRRI